MKLTLMSKEEIARWVGERCALARRGHRWTQAELADRAGVGRGTVKRLERNGHVDVKTLVSVLGALGALDLLEGVFGDMARPAVSPLVVRASGGDARAPSVVRRVRHARRAVA